MALDDVPRCQHVKLNGTQCGSPALRRRRFCFFHDKIRCEQAKIRATAPTARFALPLLEDANSVQVALMHVIQMLGSGTIDHKTAGLMLYALQTASNNLRSVDFEADEVTDVVIDRDTVAATCIDGPQWFEEDFECGEEDDEEEGDELEGDEEESDEEESDEEDDDEEKDVAEAAAHDKEPAHTIQAESAPKPPAKKEVKHVTLEEARKKVQAVARNWLAETAAQKPQ
jgi:hypothetical protein